MEPMVPMFISHGELEFARTGRGFSGTIEKTEDNTFPLFVPLTWVIGTDGNQVNVHPSGKPYPS